MLTREKSLKIYGGRRMPDDLQREEELFFKALEEYKEKKSQEPKDKTTNTLPAVIAAVL